MTERVRAELRRSGGLAGHTLDIRLDSAQLPPAEAARLLHLVSAIDFSTLPRTPTLPRGADLMRYDLTLHHGHRHWQGTVHDPAPRRLQPLLQFLSTTHPSG